MTIRTLLDIGRVVQLGNLLNVGYAPPLLEARRKLLAQTPRSELRRWPAGFAAVLQEFAAVYAANARLHACNALEKLVKQSLHERLVSRVWDCYLTF